MGTSLSGQFEFFFQELFGHGDLEDIFGEILIGEPLAP